MERGSIHDTLESYIHNLDALRESLVPVMIMASAVQKAASEQHLKVLRQHGTLISETETSAEFKVPVAHIRLVERKRRRYERSVSALGLLPRTFLVSFVSEFDSFVARLMREMLAIRPEVLNQSERQLTYKELLNFKSMEDAREFLVQGEIDSVMRDSHADQFKWMEKKFDVKLTVGLPRWPVFIEATERRNLFVHCDGRVSNQYLRVCRDHKVDLTGISLDQSLNVDKEYLISAYKVLYEFGVKLCQVLWRKLVPAEMEKADSSLNFFCYELLAEEKYDLATRLLEFAVDVLPRHSSETFRRMAVVNLSQAYKFSGREAECMKRLDAEDWSASGDNFSICIAVLKDDFVGAATLMTRIGKNGAVKESDYSEWPIFRKFRESAEFKEAFTKVFGHEPEGVEAHRKDLKAEKLQKSELDLSEQGGEILMEVSEESEKEADGAPKQLTAPESASPPASAN
jgi:hypothetical protein